MRDWSSVRSFVGMSALVVGCTALVVCSFCWPPDLMRGGWTEVGPRHDEGKGECAVKQKWVGDGYLTVVEVGSADSPLGTRRFLLDGDAIKWWRVQWMRAGSETRLVRNGQTLAVMDEAAGSVPSLNGVALREFR
jgi:hypothetical protein